MAVSKFNHRCRTFHALSNHVHRSDNVIDLFLSEHQLGYYGCA
jgi:hypothetical protein